MRPGDVYEVSFEFTASLFPGVYYLNCGVSGTLEDYDGFLHRVIDAVAFRVRNVYSKLITGFTDFDFRSSYKLLESDPSRPTIASTAKADGEPMTATAQ